MNRRTIEDAGQRRSKSLIEEITQSNVEQIAQLELGSHNRRTIGERVSDIVAACVGSWTFLIVQSTLLVLWMALNISAFWQHWDPYPFILLNLLMSFQAAFATPIILMSGNRQARLSERRNHLDLQINLLAEQENTEQLRLLRLLCEKAGIKLDPSSAEAFEQPVLPEAVVRQIVDTVEGLDRHK